jgi:hypothetical protein
MALKIAGDPYLPAYIPPGYELIQRVEGKSAQGYGTADAEARTFRFVDDQLSYVFRNGSEKDAWIFPLSVHLGESGGWALTGTEHRPGEVVELGAAGLKATYHNGIWAPGPGKDEHRSAAGGVLSWLENGVHSLTVSWRDGVWAVRGSEQRGVSRNDLLRMANSVEFAVP